MPKLATKAPVRAADDGDFNIEDNVPLPVRARKAKAQRHFPFDQLSVGQSFFVPRDKKVGLRPALKAYYAANSAERGTIYLDRQGAGRDADIRVFKRQARSRK
jgi:hypothetical protein